MSEQSRLTEAEYEKGWKVLSGETAEEYSRRTDALSLRWARQKQEEEELRQASNPSRTDSGISYTYSLEANLRYTERNADSIIGAFEAEKKKLYRGTGNARLYSEEEHHIRMSQLTAKLGKDIGGLVEEVEGIVEEGRRKARGLSYTDPTASLMSSDRDRLVTSAPLVSEDCRALPWAELAERLEAVEAGDDRVAKILHTRSATHRYKAEESRIGELARTGRKDNSPGFDRHARGRVRVLLEKLEASLRDPKDEERREQANGVISSGQMLISKLRRMQTEADGTDKTLREQAEARIRSQF